MSYIVDHEFYAQNTPISWQLYDMPNSNIAPGTLETLDFNLDNFTRYAPDEEKAMEHLGRAGYSRQNGTVVDENGNEPEITIVTATGISDAFLTHGQTSASLLEQFGFNVNLEALDNAGFSERRFTGTWDIIPDLDPLLGPVPDNTPSTWDDWYSDLYHLPDTYDLPMPIGATGDEVEGTEEFNLINSLGEWQATGDDQVFKKIAWWHNSMVPRVTPIFGPDAGRLNTSGNWAMDNGRRGITQMRPGMKNAFRYDVDGARVYWDG
jgi:ABC-type transport system substrate-binding protein